MDCGGEEVKEGEDVGGMRRVCVDFRTGRVVTVTVAFGNVIFRLGRSTAR